LFVIGYCMSVVVLIQNQFAAPTVEHQTDHKVIDSGFYALVRHPFYTALILMFSGMALWLESWAALIGIAGLVIVLIARIRVEEAELRSTLSGYAAYCERVRNRLIPFIV
ncbi:MAG: isoprenylcysteine carboxylmethyltransferase family protein, partial [Pseudomonadota bacterium]